STNAPCFQLISPGRNSQFFGLVIALCGDVTDYGLQNGKDSMRFEYILKLRYLFLVTLIYCLVPAVSQADTVYGTNITVPDNLGTGGEDNETEPGTTQSQEWDLEAFFFKNNILSMVGGYDFKNGVTAGGTTYRTGDVFLDTNKNALYGNNTPGF